MQPSLHAGLTHWRSAGTALATALALAGQVSSCVSRTSYPGDWSARTQGAGAARHTVVGTYHNLGETVDSKGGRHPVLLSELLEVTLENQANVISDKLNALGQGVAAGAAREVVVLELGERPDVLMSPLVPASYREDFERGREASATFFPDLRSIRWRVPPQDFRQAECFTRSDGSVDVVLLNSGGVYVRLSLRRAVDGSLVGQLKNEAGGMLSVIPFYVYHDSWVRFEPASPR